MYSCEENKHNLGDCFEIPPPNGGGWGTGWTYTGRSYNYQRPVFNPNNSNEFVYVLIKDSSPVEIRKHDLLSGQDELVAYKAVYYMLRFGKQGHLLFNWVDNQAWSVKLNGDSLRQLTSFGYMCLYPEWTDNGSAFIYYRELGVGNRYFIKSDFNGNTLDTLSFITVNEAPPHTCSTDGKYLAVSVGVTQKYIYDLQVETLKVINHANFNSAAYEMSFSPDGSRLLWSSNAGIHITDIFSEQTITVANGCESKKYSHPSMSMDGQKIIAGRNDLIDIDPNTLYTEFNIVVMNADGSNEQILNLPH